MQNWRPKVSFSVIWIFWAYPYENVQRHEISNNVVCATSKGSDQPAHTRSLIRAFADPWNILWISRYWLNSIWSFQAWVYTCQNATCLYASISSCQSAVYFSVHTELAGFIQANLCRIQRLLKVSPTLSKVCKIMKNTDLHFELHNYQSRRLSKIQMEKKVFTG